jgi:hypothetical protein
MKTPIAESRTADRNAQQAGEWALSRPAWAGPGMAYRERADMASALPRKGKP